MVNENIGKRFRADDEQRRPPRKPVRPLRNIRLLWAAFISCSRDLMKQAGKGAGLTSLSDTIFELLR